MPKNTLGKILNFVAWLTGVLVSLAVGFGMINKILVVPYIGIVNVIAGWIVIIATLIGVIIGIAKMFA